MSHSKDTVNYVVPQNAMSLARDFDNILRTYEEKAGELQEKFKQEMEVLNATCKLEASRAWVGVAQSVGIDAQATWSDPNYVMDRTYLAEGFCAIRFVPHEPHPLMGVFGGMSQENQSEKPPPKSKLN